MGVITPESTENASYVNHHICISRITQFLTIYYNHNYEPQITIYYKSEHVHHHLHVYYDKFIKSKHKSHHKAQITLKSNHITEHESSSR
jgi:hypothetical protein